MIHNVKLKSFIFSALGKKFARKHIHEISGSLMIVQALQEVPSNFTTILRHDAVPSAHDFQNIMLLQHSAECVSAAGIPHCSPIAMHVD